MKSSAYGKLGEERNRAAARIAPFFAALFATLLALPTVAQIPLPTEPLTTSSRVPPNILFILDDSTSMTADSVGGSSIPNPLVTSITGGGLTGSSAITNLSYVGNTVFYNPNISYEAWVQYNGSPMTGGDSYTSALSHVSLASGTINLSNNCSGGVDSCGYGVSTSGSPPTRTFYVPKPGIVSAAALGDATNYYRFQIFGSGTHANRVVRSERMNSGGSLGLSNANCSTSSGWQWKNCQYARPGSRTDAQELRNYAIWYSYHRTRMKAAKASAGMAFNDLGGDVRVGFRTINGNHQFDIPVTRNQGLFTDVAGAANRSTWYQRLYGAAENSSTRYTPLRGALRDAGEYFSDDSDTGPYGNGMDGVAETDQYSCRQNFAILTTDGSWNRDSSGLNVGDADGTAGPNGYVVEAPYSDGVSRSNTLADVAMYYWKNDLRGEGNSPLANDVPTSAGNPAFWQHMVTFGISIGVQGNINPNGPYPGQPGSTYTQWPNPLDASNPDQPNADLSRRRIDDLLHATINGRGTFLAANDPGEFAAGLKKALKDISEITGSFSNVAANSTRLETGTQVFQASYRSGVWVGELVAYDVTTSGTPPAPTVSATAAWTASGGIPAVANRNVFTMNDAGTGGASFPTANQTAALARAVAPIVTGAENAAYIKGDTSKELRFSGGTLRNRSTLLGDIVGSSPAYVRETDTIYVGANDGMLHAIDAENGEELFAYVPRGINLADLGTISDPDYQHRYFVDGPVVVSTRQQTPDKNILVGTLGKGGKGIFALDVTSPGDFAHSHVLWERNADNNVVTTGDNNLGLIQGRPIIAKLNNGVTAAIFGNGINSTNQRAVLFIYNLETGALIAEIDTGEGSAAASNGLSAPVGWDSDGNGTVDIVYAGDMLGNVWRFDLSSSTPATWQTSASRTRLFSASTTRPITAGLSVAMHPTTYKTWVFFGTGRLMTQGDIENLDVQAIYGIVDENTTVTNSQLQERTVVTVGTGSNGRPVRGFQARQALDADRKGWYINLLTPPSGSAEGERVVSDPQVVGSVLVFASVIPERNACRPDGRGYLNALDAFTGTSTGPSFFDLDRDGDFTDEMLDNNGNPVPVGSVDLGVGMPTLPNLLNGLAVVGGSSGRTSSVPTRNTRNTGRVSWREIIGD